MDRTQALKAIKNGAIAATVSGVFTLGVVIFALSSSAQGDLATWNDPANFIDVVLVFLCAFGIYRKSRTAAVVLLIYFIVSKIMIALSMGQVRGLLVSLIFLYFFARAVQGTFTFHKLERAENPAYKPPPRWYWFVGIPFGVIMFSLVGMGLLTMTGTLPSTEVLPGSRLPSHQVETLLSERIIDEGEQVEYFYSAGLFSILEDGNLLTDQRVISYFKNEQGELEIYELYLPEISDVILIEEGSYLNDSIYQLHGQTEDAWFNIVLSAEMGGDLEFIQRLKRLIYEQQQGAGMD